MQQKLRNMHLITGVNPQKGMVSLTLEPCHRAFFPTKNIHQNPNTLCHSITKPEQELFCQELFFYKDLKKKREREKILKNQISLLIRLACLRENKKYVAKITEP